MDHLLLLLSLGIIGAAYANTASWTGLTVKFGFFSTLFKNKYWMFNVPITVDQTVESGEWVPTDIENYYNLTALSFKVDYDYGFNPLYDDNGFIAGLHVCQPYETARAGMPPTYDPLTRGTVELKTIGGSNHYCSSMLLVSPDTILAGGRSEMGDSIGEGIWLRDTSDTENGYTKIPDDIDTLLEETVYQWENCVPNMGTHFYWNTTKDLDCDTRYNWFLLGDLTTNSLNGLGFQLPTAKSVYNTNFYDFAPRFVAELTVPTVNECFYESVETYGSTSIHIFFTNNPEDITCTSEDNVDDVFMTKLIRYVDKFIT